MQPDRINGVSDTFRAILERTDTETISWVAFAVISCVILVSVLGIHVGGWIGSRKQQILYVVMIVALCFLMLVIAVPRVGSTSELAINASIVLAVLLIVALLVVRWFGGREDRDNLVRPAVFAAIYFVVFGLFSRLEIAYGGAALFGSMYGVLAGLIISARKDIAHDDGSTNNARKGEAGAREKSKKEKVHDPPEGM